MISIISINNSNNNTIITTTSAPKTTSGSVDETQEKMPQIDDNIPREELQKPNHNHNNNNSDCDHNYNNNRKYIDNYGPTVVQVVRNGSPDQLDHHHNHHAQLVVHHSRSGSQTTGDEYEVDEGFNEDSASSITSNSTNSSIVGTTVSVPGPSAPTYPPPPLPTTEVSAADTLAATESPLQSPNLVQIHNTSAPEPSPMVMQSLSRAPGSRSGAVANGSNAKKFNTVRNRIQSYKEMIKIANTSKADLQRDYVKEEQNQCVLYITSMGIIRQTYERCRQLKAILIQHMIRFDERDIYINPNFKTELIERTDGGYELPVLYINGKSIGNLDVLERLNECGQLIHLLADFRLSSGTEHRPVVAKVCECCGGTKFIPCQSCNGSTKSQVHHFVSDSISLKCSQCRRSGLQKCPKCYSNGAPNDDDTPTTGAIDTH